jgi:hypothetical protein
VWEELSTLLKDPERLRTGIERMLEEQRAAHCGDPGRELKHWHGELEKIKRMRSGYLDQQAKEIISMAELKAKIAALDERRTVVEQELRKRLQQQERIAQLERDTEALMERYRFEAREGLDLYTPQDRHEAYKALGIKVIAHPDGTTELTGSALVETHSDNVRSKPIERSHSPLATDAMRPLLTVTPTPESRYGGSAKPMSTQAAGMRRINSTQSTRYTTAPGSPRLFKSLSILTNLFCRTLVRLQLTRRCERHLSPGCSPPVRVLVQSGTPCGY